MTDTLKSAKVTGTGHVEILRIRDGVKWRVAIAPHDATALDTYAPEIGVEDRQEIMDVWATVPTPEPTEVF